MLVFELWSLYQVNYDLICVYNLYIIFRKTCIFSFRCLCVTLNFRISLKAFLFQYKNLYVGPMSATYVHSLPVVRITTLISHITHVVCLVRWEVFYCNFSYFQSFFGNLLSGSCQRKYFFIYLFVEEIWPGVWIRASCLCKHIACNISY